MVNYERMHKIQSMNRCALFLLLIILGNAPNLYSADTRNKPIDIFILVDKSAAMADAIADAREWICATVVDGMAIPGDRVHLWTFSDSTERLYQGTVVTEEFRETLKKTLRSVAGDAKAPDIAAALSAFLAEASSRADRSTIAYVLVAGSMTDRSLKALGDGKTEELLRFSRVEARPGWKAVVVGIHMEDKVRELTKRYLQDTVAP